MDNDHPWVTRAFRRGGMRIGDWAAGQILRDIESERGRHGCPEEFDEASTRKTGEPIGRVRSRLRRKVSRMVGETDLRRTAAMLDQARMRYTLNGFHADKDMDMNLMLAPMVRGLAGGVNLAALLLIDAIGAAAGVKDGGRLMVLSGPDMINSTVLGDIALHMDGAMISWHQLSLRIQLPETVLDAMPGRRLGTVVEGLPPGIAAIPIGERYGDGFRLLTTPDPVSLKNLAPEDCVPITANAA